MSEPKWVAFRLSQTGKIILIIMYMIINPQNRMKFVSSSCLTLLHHADRARDRESERVREQGCMWAREATNFGNPFRELSNSITSVTATDQQQQQPSGQKHPTKTAESEQRILATIIQNSPTHNIRAQPRPRVTIICIEWVAKTTTGQPPKIIAIHKHARLLLKFINDRNNGVFVEWNANENPGQIIIR